MNIDVQLPDEFVRAADVLAARLGMSRSDVIVAALGEYVAKHEAGEITARLDRLYATEPSGLDPVLRRVQRESVGAEDFLRPGAYRIDAPERHRRLAEACAMLDPAEERAVAEGRGEPD